MRTFESGATRGGEEGKLDYEGFLSPLALEAYANYMHGHRLGEDGKLRASDNWQKGIPLTAYMKSLWRHFFTAWDWHRTPGDWGVGSRALMIEALCGILFNTFGYLHVLVDYEDVSNEELKGLTEENKPGTLPPSG